MKPIRLLFLYLFMVVVVIAFIELSAYGLYWIAFKRPLWFADIEAFRQSEDLKRNAQGNPNVRVDITGPLSLHPYTGYSFAPQGGSVYELASSRPFPTSQCTVDRLGFIAVGESDPAGFPAQKPGEIYIAVSGGSVATQFICYSGNDLLRELSAAPQFRGKTLKLIGLAAGAWRQPQQALALAYLQTLRINPSIVINLDGYNETANAFMYHQRNLFTLYPLYWPTFLVRLPVGVEEQLAVTHLLKNALVGLSKKLPYSATAALIARLSGRMLDARAARLVVEGGKVQAQERSPQSALGPVLGTAESEDISNHAWYRASLQMHLLTKSVGGRYFHFFQPTPLWNKPLSTQEKAWGTDPQAKSAIGRNYPLIKKLGGDLRKQGVEFFDLSDIFSGTTGTVYLDGCCHMYPDGNAVLYQHLVRNVLTALKTAQR